MNKKKLHVLDMEDRTLTLIMDDTGRILCILNSLDNEELPELLLEALGFEVRYYTHDEIYRVDDMRGLLNYDEIIERFREAAGFGPTV